MRYDPPPRSNSMHIRRAVADDASALAALRWQFRSEGRGALSETEAAFVERCSLWMRDRLTGDGRWAAWVAEEAHQLVGQIWAQIIEKLPNPTHEPEQHAYISNLYVKPFARGGVGTKLLEACLAWLAEQDVDTILLWPPAASRPLYERHGFNRADTILVRDRS
jgi:GNAT superfamily N-acetyltransferase